MGDKEGTALGKNILTLAVLSIIITAPIGAAIIAITGPLFLHRTPPAEEAVEYKAEEDEESPEDRGYVSVNQSFGVLCF